MRTIGVIQPSYLPWRGYFDFIHEVDTFVFLDDVQYTVRDWRNRNRIKQPDGSLAWLTVPVQGGRHQLIKDVRIDTSQPWRRKHLAAITASYGRARYFDRYFGLLSGVFASRIDRLVDLDIELTMSICNCLGIHTELVRASSLNCPGTKDDKLLEIVRRLGGTRYLSGPTAASYIRPEIFEQADIELSYKDYSGYPEYPQIAGPFEPAVSIIDLLFMVGPAAPDYIWGRLREVA